MPKSDAPEPMPPQGKMALFASIVDRKRTELSSSELCQFTWERISNDANVDLGYTDRADPESTLGDVCTFHPCEGRPHQGTMSAVPGVPGYGITGGAMKWRLSRLLHRRTGSYVTCVSNGPIDDFGPEDGDDGAGQHQHYYPPKPVWRTPNWGWKMRCALPF
jgi:hypothetical protein